MAKPCHSPEFKSDKRTCVTALCLSKNPDFRTSKVLPAIWGTSRQLSVILSPRLWTDHFLLLLNRLQQQAPAFGNEPRRWYLSILERSAHKGLRESVWKWTFDIYPAISLSGATDMSCCQSINTHLSIVWLPAAQLPLAALMKTRTHTPLPPPKHGNKCL